jgi:hypothetical protein
VTFLKRLLFWFAPWLCLWHKGEPAVSYNPEGDDAPAYCPECGRMLDTRECVRCGMTFLEWESQSNFFDDVMARPIVNDRGDVQCAGCYVPEQDLEEEGEADACDVEEL